MQRRGDAHERAGKRNRGVEERAAADESVPADTDSERVKLARSRAALERKARLYDALAQGGTSAGAAAAKGADFLVDFERKELEGSTRPGHTPVLAGGNPDQPSTQCSAAENSASGGAGGGAAADEPSSHDRGMIEIQDEFGRSIWVKRGSKEHLRWRQATRRAHASLYSASMAMDDERRAWEAETMEAMERGDDANGTGEASSGVQASSIDGGVRQMWEQGLSHTEKLYLRQIAEETRGARAAVAAGEPAATATPRQTTATAGVSTAALIAESTGSAVSSATSQRKKRANELFKKLVAPTVDSVQEIHAARRSGHSSEVHTDQQSLSPQRRSPQRGAAAVGRGRAATLPAWMAKTAGTVPGASSVSSTAASHPEATSEWFSAVDPSSGRTYYYDRSGHTTWERPRAS